MIANNTPRRGFNSKSLLADYYKAAFVPLLPPTTTTRKRASYKTALSLFDEFLRRPAMLVDLNNETLAGFLAWLPDRGYPVANGPRDRLLSVWRFASSRHRVDTNPDDEALPRAKRPCGIPPASELSTAARAETSSEASSGGRLDPKTPLVQYVETILAPEIHRAGAGGESLRMTEHALRWLDALLKRAPTLADLSGFASSATMPAELVRFIVAHDRLPSTGKAMVGRLFALWKAVVWAGHMPPIGGPPKLPAVKRLKPRREGATPYGGIPTREAIERGRAVGQVAPTLPQVITAPATLETTLLSFLVDYYAMERPLAAASIDRGYGAAIQSFSRFLGRPATLADLVAPTVNAWIASRDGIGSPNTASSHRRQLLVLWRFAYETEVLNELPRRIRKVKTPRRVIEGWDTEQMGRLLAAADQLSGSFRKTRIERRLWWRAFLLTAWYTGLRLGDVLAIRFDSITQSPDGGGRLTVVMSKTGDTIDRVLPASAMQAILASMASSPRETCFPLWVDQRHFYRAAKALIHSAGLRGTIRWIRRGSASEAERIKAGAGRAHLGHRTVGLFESNYRVDRITQQEVILPPEPAFQPTLRLEHKIDANQAGEAKGGAH